MKLERFRKFNTRNVLPRCGRHDNDMCMVVRPATASFCGAGPRTGLDLDGDLRDPADPAAQAHQAMDNARELLEEAGSSLDHVTMVTTCLTDPGYRAPVYRTVADHLHGNHTVGTGLIVKGLALPEMKLKRRPRAGSTAPPGPTRRRERAGQGAGTSVSGAASA